MTTTGLGVPPVRPTLDEVIVRPLVRTDIDVAVALERRVHRDPWSARAFTAELAERSRHYVAAVLDGTVLGFGGSLLAADELHITTLVVDPLLHRRKLASRMLLALLDDGVSRGAEAATLEVRATNRGAQRLYTTFGFAPVGVRPGYYDRPAVGGALTREDAIIMWAYGIGGLLYAARLDQQRQRLAQPGGASGAPDLQVPHVGPRAGLPASTQGVR